MWAYLRELSQVPSVRLRPHQPHNLQIKRLSHKGEPLMGRLRQLISLTLVLLSVELIRTLEYTGNCWITQENSRVFLFYSCFSCVLHFFTGSSKANVLPLPNSEFSK